MNTRTWSEWFWLPKDLTWKQIEEQMGSDYPDINQFCKCAFVFCFLLLILRNYIITPFVLEPIGRRAGVREKPYAHPPPNKELELLYKINRARPPRRKLVEAAAKIDWTERKVERWLRLKALSMQMTTLEKFCDQGWQAIFYSCFFISGLLIIVPQSYFWNPMETMENLPFQRTPSIIWWYSAVDCGFYVTQTITLFSQDRRHDFYVMLCHHMVTFLIYYFCVSMNIINLLTLSVFLHEMADIPLAAAKMFDYSNKNHLSEYLIAVFTVVWVSTRLIGYPLMAMSPPLRTPSELISPSMVFFKIFGFVLLFLHISWTVDLVISIKRRLSSNKISDCRSSQEELSEEEEPASLEDKKRVTQQVCGALSDDISLRKPARSLM